MPPERKWEEPGWQAPREEAEAANEAQQPAAAGEWPHFMFEEPESTERERPARRVDEPTETVEKASRIAAETAGVGEGRAAVTEEGKPSRRRRRRRRKTREPGRVAGEQRESEKAEQVSQAAAEEPEEGEATGEEGQPEKGRSRRRRKRAPLREKERTSIPDQPAADQPERGPTKPAKAAAKVEKPAEIETEEDETAESETEEDEAEQGARFSKVGHRAIPTWEEAVGMIISTNLESRAKNPSTGFSRGRGKGRGPSKEQGSRRRPPDKKRN
jgi:ribonuclease E